MIYDNIIFLFPPFHIICLVPSFPPFPSLFPFFPSLPSPFPLFFPSLSPFLSQSVLSGLLINHFLSLVIGRVHMD